jgi:hypothetical protein
LAFWCENKPSGNPAPNGQTFSQCSFDVPISVATFPIFKANKAQLLLDPGLPDGIFLYQKWQFWKSLEMENF